MPNVTKVGRLCLALGSLFWLPSGSTFAAHETSQRLANKKLIIDYFAAIDSFEASKPGDDRKRRIRDVITRYVRPDFVQHGESFSQYGTGREALIRTFQSMFVTVSPELRRTRASVVTVTADRDLIIRVNTRESPEAKNGRHPLYIFNLFRIKDHQIVEHWDGYSNGQPFTPAQGPETPARSPGAVASPATSQSTGAP
jgi:predicted SnoaL-like aldol condensation-catalyzing enzyme